MVAIAGHPYLALLAAMGAGVLSGFITALLQTKMGIDSLLAGIIVNTGLYSVNIAVMGGSSLLNMNKTETVFTKARALLQDTFLAEQYKLLVAAIAVIAVIVFLALFLHTRLGLAIRATGDNPDIPIRNPPRLCRSVPMAAFPAPDRSHAAVWCRSRSDTPPAWC